MIKINQDDLSFNDCIITQMLIFLGNSSPNTHQIELLKNLLDVSDCLKKINNDCKELEIEEKSCLLLIAHGMSKKEIAKILNMPMKKIANLIKKIKEKLRVKNIQEAIYKAIQQNDFNIIFNSCSKR